MKETILAIDIGSSKIATIIANYLIVCHFNYPLFVFYFLAHSTDYK